MKRKSDSLGNVLIMAPWWVSAILGALAYIGLKFVAPCFGGENLFLKPFADAMPQLAPYAALLFGMIAVLSYFFGLKQSALVDKQQSLESLCEVSWKEFEWLVGEVFRRQGYRIEESLGGGADGGIDLILRRDGQTTLVQCKRWKNKPVGVPIIREIFGILTAENADRAMLITTSKFTKESENFAAKKPIELIDGQQLLEMVKSVKMLGTKAPQEQKSAPEQVNTPNITAPLCPKCNSTMVRRTARRGANAGNAFWGCNNYPKCRSVISIEN